MSSKFLGDKNRTRYTTTHLKTMDHSRSFSPEPRVPYEWMTELGSDDDGELGSDGGWGSGRGWVSDGNSESGSDDGWETDSNRSSTPPPIHDKLYDTPFSHRSALSSVPKDGLSFTSDVASRPKVDSKWLKDSKCLDVVMFDHPSTIDYLLEKPSDNVVIHNPSNSSENSLVCITRSYITKEYRNPKTRFYECVGIDLGGGDRNMRIPNMSKVKVFIKLPLGDDGTNYFITAENAKAFVNSGKKTALLSPVLDRSGTQVMVTHSVTEAVYLGGDVVSANHGQRGSNFMLYRLQETLIGECKGRSPKLTPKLEERKGKAPEFAPAK